MGIQRRPEQLGNAIRPPAVYVSEDLKDWRIDGRLHATSIILCAGIRGGSAQVEVDLDRDFGVREALETYIGIGKYILIDTGEEDAGNASCLFAGRIVRPVLGIGGDGEHYEESVGLDCEHICNDLKNLWIAGRVIQRNPHLADTLAEGDASPDEIAAQMAANFITIPKGTIFNYRGKRNMSSATITRQTVDGAIECPLFSGQEDGYDSSASAWTYRRVFRYLIGWYAGSDQEIFDFTLVDFSKFVAILNRPGTDKTLDNYLDQETVELNIQGCHLLEAIDKVARASGIKYGYPVGYSRDQVCFSFRAWAPGTGTATYFRLEESRKNIVENGWPEETAEELLENNNLNTVHLGFDSSEIVTDIHVSGSPVRVEFTTELVPGWPIDAVLDTPADVSEAKKAAAKHWGMEPADMMADAWYRLYHYDGVSAAQSLNYGRLWVLNEDGAYPEGEETSNDDFPYNRDSFEVVTRLKLADEIKTLNKETYDWAGNTATRPRKFLPCLTTEASGKSQGIVVDMSYDGGSNWHALQSGVRNLDNRCGVYLAIGDLSRLTPPGVDDPAGGNAWWALLDKKFRLRVTASIELDIEVYGAASFGSPVAYWLMHTDPNLRLWKRLGLSKYRTTSLPAAEYDDRSKASTLAARILQAKGQYQLPGQFVLPWLETEYDIGDVVEKIDGREIPLSLSIGSYTASPEVYQIIWRAGKSWSTEICLTDHRMASQTV